MCGGNINNLTIKCENFTSQWNFYSYNIILNKAHIEKAFISIVDLILKPVLVRLRRT